jgi:hypothetical protein
MQRSSGFSLLRHARRLFLGALITIFSATLLLRLDAAIVEYRVLAVLRKMEEFKLGQTSRLELVNSVERLYPASCATGSECLAERLSNWSSGLLYRFPKLYGVYSRNQTVYTIGHWLGFRVCDFTATFELREKKIHNLGYRLLVDDGSNQYPGAILINAGTAYGYADRGLIDSEDESPEYSVRRYFKWPELWLSIWFTPRAPATLSRHAFEPSLNCIWTLLGCRTTEQILPRAWEDEENIQHAVDVRLHGSNPCPDRILPRRARDTSDILLVEVKDASPELEDENYGKYRVVTYDLLRVLKGTLTRPLKAVGHPLVINDPGKAGQHRPNPAIQLLHPGTRVLMFSDSSTNVDTPCEIVAATDSAMQTIRSALAQPVSHIVETDRSGW